jgi:hypothetical protein
VQTLYRVFPIHPDTPPDQPGGALYVPPQGAGRLDNPDLYSILYLSDAAPGAIAEAFGRFPEWTPAILAGAPALPGSARALGTYETHGDLSICDLDDARRLVSLRLRPSEVVTRDYSRTRTWARTVYEQRAWSGIRWWSFYDPQWGSIGLWNIADLRLRDVRVLRLDDPDLLTASRTILRRVIPSASPR